MKKLGELFIAPAPEPESKASFADSADCISAAGTELVLDKSFTEIIL